MTLFRGYVLERTHRAVLLPLGRDLYRQKEFKDALVVFKAAIAQRTPKIDDDSERSKSEEYFTIKLYDYRAATYEKLGKLELALKDAKKMIELEEASQAQRGQVSGYLRTARVLEAMGKVDLAQKILERGLERGRKGAEGFSMLGIVYDRLTRPAAATPGAVDPLHVLPVEVVEMVFEYVPFHTLCACLRVSKHWRDYLAACPRLWNTIDFAKTKRTVRLKVLDDYMKFAQYRVKKISLKMVNLYKTKVIENIFKKCRNLGTLELIGGGYICEALYYAVPFASEKLVRLDIVGTANTSLSTLTHVAKHCSSLEHIAASNVTSGSNVVASWSNCSKLKTLKLQFESKPLICRFRDLVPPAENLEILELRSVRESFFGIDRELGEHPALQELTIDNFDVVQLVTIPSTVRKVEMLRIREHSGVSGQKLLHLLALGGSSEHITGSGGLLDTLDFNAGSFIGTDIKDVVSHERLAGLSDLRIHECLALDDATVEVITSNMKHLKRLALPHSGITGVGVRKIVEELSCDFIDLEGCNRVHSDVVEWAKERGVTIKLKKRY